MRVYDCFQYLPYAFEQVSTIFWQRYPNSTSKHVVSEDVIQIEVSLPVVVPIFAALSISFIFSDFKFCCYIW